MNPDLLTRPATFADALRSEWTKLRSLRSTTSTLLTACVLAVGFAALIAGGAGTGYASLAPDEQAAFDPTATSLRTYVVVQLAVAALGVLVVTSEYATGMIHTSLAAVPRRGRLLGAKALVFAWLALATGQVAAFASYFVGQAFLAGAGAPHTVLSDPGVLRAVIGQGLYLAAIGLLGVAVGVLVRATAGGIIVMVAVTLFVPAFAPALPEGVATFLGHSWPAIAGTEIMSVMPATDGIAPWPGLAVLWAWTLAALAVAFAVFRRRDA